MSKTRTKTSKNPIREIKRHLDKAPVQLVEILMEKDNPGGLLVLCQDFPLSTAIEKLHKDHTISNKISHTENDTISLEDLVTIELERIRLTKLPCSLLLLACKCRKKMPHHPTQTLKNIIAASLHKTDVLTNFTSSILAVLIPGSGLGRAVQRAKELISEPSATLSATLTAGLAVCHADDNLTASAFIAKAEKHLQLAEKMNGSKINLSYSKGEKVEHACQVTVEERTQLFQFFQNNGGR